MINELFNYTTLSAVLGATLGAFFTSYLKKKGENFATKEDFEQLLSQLKKTTHETETIKVELSRGSWVNQQQWMLRERYYVGLLDSLYTLKDSLESIQTWYMEPGSEHRDTDINKNDGFKKLLNTAYQAFTKIKELHGPAELVVSGNAIKALKVFYSEYWFASEFSVCNSEWLDRAHASVLEAHKVVLTEAKLQLVPSFI